MTWEIAAIYGLLVLALASFAWEKVSPDVTAITLFAVLLITGLLPADQALRVFSNPAPITVGAMFVISAALQRTGAIEALAGLLSGMSRLRYPWFVFVLTLVVATASAFINNTPVVVVFLPIVLSLARQMNIAASKLLIPLSYASIFGGTCTLIGTSTNILVSGIGTQAGHAPFGMFELAFVGVPLLIAGSLYLMIFGQKLLPVRETLTSILTEEERREYLTEAFVRSDSPLLGKNLTEANLLRRRGIRVIEVIRNGVPLPASLLEIVLQAGDRILLACRPSGLAEARQMEGVDFTADADLGLEQISAHEGMMVEGIVAPGASIIGRTIKEVNFRQRFRMVVLAIHRRGVNVRNQLHSIRFEFGDTLLLLGTEGAIQNLRTTEDILLVDKPPIHADRSRWKLWLVVCVVAGIIGSAALDFARIEFGAIVGCAILFVTGCVRPKDGYGSIQWNLLFIIFGMLGMGLAMEHTGASTLLAETMVQIVNTLVSPEWRPLIMLACIYLATSILTEILSNNAAVVIMATLALGVATTLGVDARPFLIATAVAGSASFATPIGYQTNTYVYGVGGYRFSDFIRIGLPLNIICFFVTVGLVVVFWSF